MKEPISNDTELFLRVKKGDDGAFGELFDKYYPRVLNIIYRFLYNRDDAEDMTQDVFVRVYRASKTFVPKAKFSTWLYRVTINRCFSHYKRVKREKDNVVNEADLRDAVGDLSSPLVNKPSSIRSPAEHAIDEETHQEIQAALDRLPSDRKMALILREYEGFSYKEIAAMFGCSVKAVERRIYHARQQLKVLLTKNGVS